MGVAAATATERLQRQFASRGLVVLAPEELGLPAEIHERIYEQERRVFQDNRTTISTATVPEVLEVLAAPGLVAACDALLGKHWAIVPFTHNAPFASGAHDQHWHKDDNGPFNGRKQRHHQAVQVELLYYPQAVAEDAGPTAVVPYSHYWAFNHEENQDNFAGADHLDFAYHLSGMERVPVSGPKSAYDEADVRAARTPHDERMRQAVADTGWPLVRQFEVASLAAGSVVLYSHNLFHRGNHRRDDWREWAARPRFMWRFWLYRTTQPEAAGSVAEVDWRSPAVDAMTGVDVAGATVDATAVWRYQHHWLRRGEPPPPVADQAVALGEQLHAMHEAAEPARIGAAYRLAALPDRASAAVRLGEALHSEREAVRRAAAYGLAALGEAATEPLLAALASPVKWVRKGAVFALGEAGETTATTAAALTERLAADASVYVRSVAAAALGCLGRRAVAAGAGATVVPIGTAALVASLGREPNRLAMNLAQKRHIKIVRPTDECDVCEGIGINYGLERFDPVRSAVRENALWALVVLCSHGVRVLGEQAEPLIAALAAVAREDRNIFAVGTALDALNRLARLVDGDSSPRAEREVDALMTALPAHCWEALLRGGLPLAKARAAA